MSRGTFDKAGRLDKIVRLTRFSASDLSCAVTFG